MANRVQYTRVCATEGCHRFLKSRWPHPECPACRGEEDLPPPPRPGTRTTFVRSVSSTSNVIAISAVTLPAEPWSAA